MDPSVSCGLQLFGAVGASAGGAVEASADVWELGPCWVDLDSITVS